MARTGITYFDVETAALHLQGQGKTPTVDGIRQYLGTGSKTTISHHLNIWKAQQVDGEGQLPHQLSALVQGLWERLQQNAEQRINEAKQAHEEAAHTWQATLLIREKEFNTLQQHLHALTQNHQQQTKAKVAIEEQMQTLQQAHSQLETRYHLTVEQLADTQADNSRLHKLANHMQTNLEHYQQAAQTLRTEQALESEKREAELKQEITLLKHELVKEREQCTNWQVEVQLKSQACTQTQQTLALLQAQYDQIYLQRQTEIEKITRLSERNHQLEADLHHYQEDAKMMHNCLKALETEVALLTNQRQALEHSLKQTEDKIEKLRHENLFLTQAKAELAGILKQLNKIKTDK